MGVQERPMAGKWVFEKGRWLGNECSRKADGWEMSVRKKPLVRNVLARSFLDGAVNASEKREK